MQPVYYGLEVRKVAKLQIHSKIFTLQKIFLQKLLIIDAKYYTIESFCTVYTLNFNEEKWN
jgi:hypothetical protein